MNKNYIQVKFSRLFKWLPKAIEEEAKETGDSYTHIILEATAEKLKDRKPKKEKKEH